ncbi:SDR family oxidoreductase [Sphingomonas bacterium]|uniref:SDR family oxidoreductase n=1 Tax=Sphingomonas bacterium TaxID=1895847 RepID=UPI00157615F9|nr:NmrA family NAD(P)-binding protein [Sphingomonas bacterium]
MILVNAANGQQGKLLVPKLIAQGLDVRACVRSEASAADLRAAGVKDVVVGDISQPDVIARAIRGVDKVYHVCPGIHPREREMGLAWIDAAKAEGVGHFVFSSVLHAIITDLVQHEIKRDIEEYLVSSGLEYTILQPTIYMAPRRFTRVFETGVLRAGWSLDRHQSLVDIGDVTDVAASVLVDSERHAGATYELVAAGRYTARDMGEIIGRVLGKTIAVEEIGPDAYLKGLFGDQDLDTMPHEASVGRSLTDRYSSHDFIGNANVLTWLLGRPPTSFEQFVSRHNPSPEPVSGN